MYCTVVNTVVHVHKLKHAHVNGKVWNLGSCLHGYIVLRLFIIVYQSSKHTDCQLVVFLHGVVAYKGARTYCIDY